METTSRSESNSLMFALVGDGESKSLPAPREYNANHRLFRSQDLLHVVHSHVLDQLDSRLQVPNRRRG